jgi:hypothetical protein
MNLDLLNIIPILKEKYKQGENLINFITLNYPGADALKSAINISYDIQSGSYVENYKRDPAYYEAYLTDYAAIINQLGPIKNIVEAGVGEATTLIPLFDKLTHKPTQLIGFDSSWSRILTANKFASDLNTIKPMLAVGNFFNCPLKDNSIDLVLTSHAIEPNGGLEKEALEELYRITKKYLVMFEPIYEFADQAGKDRMNRLGYVKGLKQTAIDLGYNVIRYELLSYNNDLSNPTGVIVIQKDINSESEEIQFCDPVSKLPLQDSSDCMYNQESGLSYPKIMGIPCLKIENAVVTTKI